MKPTDQVLVHPKHLTVHEVKAGRRACAHVVMRGPTAEKIDWMVLPFLLARSYA